jgi:TP901 family phage tail tape measure protein
VAENGVELAKAYVQIVPSMQGMKGALETELNGTGDIGRQAGGKLGEGLTAAFSKAIEFIGDSVRTGMGFDTAMSQVAATMGKTTDEIAELRDYAKEMGAETAFSATQSAEALNFMALAGYDANTSMKMLPNVMNLAAAGGMELARASDMITDSQTALGLSLSETETLVDQMAKTSSTTNTSVSQLGDAMLTIGGTAKSLSGGTDELNQVLGIMADNGIKAGEAGTHLRNIILAMQPTTKDAIAAFDELGFSAYDSQGNLREMSDIFGELSEKTADMTSQERQDIIGKIFNKTDLSTVNALLDTSAERWDEVALAIDGADGAAQAMADTQLDNLQGDITLMQSAFEGLQIAISDEVTPDLRELVQTATKGLEWATEHIHTIIGVVEALGVAVVAIKLPAMIGAAEKAMLAFNAVCAANPLGAVLTAAAAAGVILKGVIDDATDAINEIPDDYSGLTDFEVETVQGMAEATDDLTEATERRMEAETLLNEKKEDRRIAENALAAAETELAELREKSYLTEQEGLRMHELESEVIPGLTYDIGLYNDAVGELSTAYVRASENEKQLIETQEAEQTAAEETAAAQEKEAEAARKAAAEMEAYTENLRDSVKEGLTMSVEIGGQTAELSRETAESIGEVIDNYDKLYESTKNTLERSVDFFGGFTASTETTFDELWKNLNDTNYYLNDWATAIEQLEDRGLGKGVVQSLRDMGTDSWEIVYALNHATDEQLAKYTSKWDDTQRDMDKITDNMMKKPREAAEKELGKLSGVADKHIEEYRNAFGKLGVKSGESFKDAISGNFEEAYKEIDGMTADEIEALMSRDEDFTTIGENLSIGLGNGIKQETPYVINAALAMARETVNAVRSEFKVESPSKVGAEIGGYFSQGVAIGVERDAELAAKAAADMAQEVITSAELDALTGYGFETVSDTARLRQAASVPEQPEKIPERASGAKTPVVLQIVTPERRPVAEWLIGDINELLGQQAVFDMRGFA